MKKYLIFFSLSAVMIAAIMAFSIEKIITGKVISEDGSPLTNASIIVKGTAIGTLTDIKGAFKLKVPGNSAVLLISAVGFNSKEVVAGNKSALVITLTVAHNNLSENAMSVQGYQQKLKASKAERTKGSVRFTSPSIMRDEEVYADERFQPHYYKKDDQKEFNREGYDHITENPFFKTTDNPLSTFSIDVDAASYSNVRRMINNNQLPPAGAVRIEELINYFSYKYPQPVGSDPFSVNTEIAVCPWNTAHRLVSIGLQGKKIATENLPPSNLTFLIDVSGSMESEDKLPLVKSSLRLLTDQLREQDKVSIVVYAGSAGLVLEPTSGSNKNIIKAAIDRLSAGGSTAGGAGIQLAYKTNQSNFIKEGNNRVILCTDGDFNVGASSDDAMERLIMDKRETGIFLTVLGFGTGNYQDAKMQKLADKGNGNHAYIDNQSEAKKVFVSEFGGTLFTIAKDVKLQVEFNAALVQGYRLIGYENRLLAKEDFNNDKKDAGEMGSGHTVTALYEIVPAGIKTDVFNNVDPLKYQQTEKATKGNAFGNELMTIKLRYKQPDGLTSKLLHHLVMDSKQPIENASENLRFAAAVAQFGMLLRNSDFKGTSSFKQVFDLAGNAIKNDAEGYRKEFLELAKKAELLSQKETAINHEE